MSSEAKILANRANAQASTGPRTAAGKAIAARNARRHGLSLPVIADPTRQPELKTMADEIAGAGASTERHELAVQIAAAQIDLVRVRRARHDLLSRSPPDPHRLRQRPEPIETQVPFMDFPRDQPETASFMSDLSRHLARLDRYERRVLSRRKFAIRDFDAAP